VTDQTSDVTSQPAQRRSRWPWVVAIVVITLFLLAVLLVLLWPRADVSTEDAYIRAHYSTVTARVEGQVIRVAADDTQAVRAGQLLVALDPTDFQVALDQAKAQLAADDAQLRQTTVAIEQQPAAVIQAEAQLRTAEAMGILARQNSTRDTLLASTGAGSVQQRQQSDAQLHQANAEISAANASVDTARRQRQALKANRQTVAAKIDADRTAVRRAELNLSYTRVVAPIDGVVDQRQVQVGNNIAPNLPVMAVVPLNSIYVEANFRELQLRHMRQGQRAKIHVDAYDIDLNGTVQGIGASSDASFSPAPPNNATGNFTKIVQRLPVRILIDPNQPDARLLRVGMSVRATIDTHLDNIVSGKRRSDAGAVQ
jgi:membrane fusion protein (multidrug efflux system)